MRPHLRYLSYVVRHKWFVLRAGLKTGAPLWRLVIHDWSKLTPAEWFPYVQTFYGRPPDAAELRRRFHGRPNDAQNLADWESDRKAAFDKAWLHQQHRNPHHHQHWLLREDDGPWRALAMPEPLVREMVADWMGAGRAITGRWDAASWYAGAAGKMILHPDTRTLVEQLVAEYGPPSGPPS
jgi:hypothetical protein